MHLIGIAVIDLPVRGVDVTHDDDVMASVEEVGAPEVEQLVEAHLVGQAVRTLGVGAGAVNVDQHKRIAILKYSRC